MNNQKNNNNNNDERKKGAIKDYEIGYLCYKEEKKKMSTENKEMFFS